jgi:hypothetical protein
MTSLLGPGVERGPPRVPVEGNGIWSLVEIVQFLEVLERDAARPLEVEQTKGNLILRIGLAEQVLKCGPV